MSPTFSSAGGLNARTRATRFSGLSSSTPGVDAYTRPFRSYVPSPGSNSSATAISSPGRTIFASRSLRSFGPHEHGPRYLALRHFYTIEHHCELPGGLPMEGEQVRNRESIFEALRNPAAGRLDSATDEGFRGPIHERVDHGAHGQGRVQERAGGMPGLRAEGRIHHHRV